LKVKAIQHL